MGRMLLHGRCYSFRRRVNSAAPHDLAGIVDDTDRSFLQGYIKADILVALGHGPAPLALQGPVRYQSRDYAMSRPAHNQCRRAQRRSRMARLRATASAARSVLDGREHGGTLGRVGEPIHTNPPVKKRARKAIKNRHHAQNSAMIERPESSATLLASGCLFDVGANGTRIFGLSGARVFMAYSLHSEKGAAIR